MKESKIIKGVIAAVAVVVFSIPAIASADAAAELEGKTEKVSFADLNVDKAAGAEQLYRRLQQASKRVCGVPGRHGRAHGWDRRSVLRGRTRRQRRPERRHRGRFDTRQPGCGRRLRASAQRSKRRRPACSRPVPTRVRSSDHRDGACRARCRRTRAQRCCFQRDRDDFGSLTTPRPPACRKFKGRFGTTRNPRPALPALSTIARNRSTSSGLSVPKTLSALPVARRDRVWSEYSADRR